MGDNWIRDNRLNFTESRTILKFLFIYSSEQIKIYKILTFTIVLNLHIKLMILRHKCSINVSSRWLFYIDHNVIAFSNQTHQYVNFNVLTYH